MRSSSKGYLAALCGVTMLGAMAVPAAAQFGGPPAPPNTGVPLYTAMTGGQGHGNVTVVIDPPKGTVCYLMNVGGLANVTAAHVHAGGPGENGPPVVPMETPEDGTSGGCAPIAADLAAKILANPGGYYVNVHTRAVPTGQIRGQLMK